MGISGDDGLLVDIVAHRSDSLEQVATLIDSLFVIQICAIAADDLPLALELGSTVITKSIKNALVPPSTSGSSLSILSTFVALSPKDSNIFLVDFPLGVSLKKAAKSSAPERPSVLS